MRLRLLLVLSVAVLPLFADRWMEFRSGPFEVITDAGGRQGREALNELEQFRHALGSALGIADLRSVWPIRVVLFESSREFAKYSAASSGLALDRDAYTAVALAKAPLPRSLWRDCARILIASSINRLPESLEDGVAVLFSTLDIASVRITVGQPPPEAERSLPWAMLHMLSVTPDYYGKLRVLVRNLAQGSAIEPAYRNAFGKTPDGIEKEAAAYLKGGAFSTVPVSGRVIRQEREFIESPLDDPRARVLLADLLLPTPSQASAAAVGVGGPAARASFDSALRISDPKQKVELLKKAADLEPRNVEYWRVLAETCLAQEQFAEAARAWTSAEQAAPNDAERARLRAIRADTEQKRLDFEEAERKRLAEEERRELEKLKQEAAESIQAALAEANRDSTPQKPGEKVVEWWDEPKAGAKVGGLLQRVDCLGSQVRLVIEVAKGKLTRLVIRDPNQLTVRGGGQVTFGCGPQRPPRKILVEYSPKPDAQLNTAGDAVVIEFLK